MDEPEVEELADVPFEVAQALAASLEEGDTPFEVDEPMAESPPHDDEEGDGDQGAYCYPAGNCDSDGDGYAWTSVDRYHECHGRLLTPEETGGIGLCPEGWVQFVEPNECNEILTDADAEAFWSKRTRPYLSQTWAGRLLTAGYWLSNYNQHHPRRGEKAGNYLDDNCDGFVDETKFVYSQSGSSPAPGQVRILSIINDRKIRQHANVIGVHLYDLAGIDCPTAPLDVFGHPAILALRAGESSYKYTASGETFIVQLPPPVTRQFFWYEGDELAWLSVTNLPNDLRVYAVALTYHQVSITSWEPFDFDFWQLKCLHPVDGAVNSSTSCTRAGRIASDVFFTAVGDESSKEQRLRALVTNRALFEWWQSEHLGHVGGPRSARPLYPDGTRYFADYGELWCTEFTSALYRWTVQDSSPFGYATNVKDMVGHFRDRHWLDEGHQARISMCVLTDPSGYGSLGPARPGDYLALATKTEAKKSHSSIFLSNAGVNRNWKIGGNEARRVKMKCSKNFEQRAADDEGTSFYVFEALGHIRYMTPVSGNP